MEHNHSPSGGRPIPGVVWLCLIAAGVAVVALMAGFPLGILLALACPLLHLVMMGHGMSHGQTTSSDTTNSKSHQPWIRIVQEGGNEMAKDLVCGMDVDEKTAPAKSEYKGQTYYFCAPGCKRAFDRDPERYLSGQSGSHH